jgi:hypothetical protein
MKRLSSKTLLVRRRLSVLVGGGVLLYASAVSSAWVTVSLPRGEVYLIVGPDTNPTGGPTVVSFSVSPAGLGTGAPVTGTPNVQLQMGVRRPPGRTNIGATLTANATATTTLDSLPNQIPISDISWTSSAVPAAPASTTLIAGGTFTGLAQTISTLTTAGTGTYWAGAVATFKFANAQVYPAGTYTATISYTASSP